MNPTPQWHSLKDNPPGAEVLKPLFGGWYHSGWLVSTSRGQNDTHWIDASPPPKPDPAEEAHKAWWDNLEPHVHLTIKDGFLAGWNAKEKAT